MMLSFVFERAALGAMTKAATLDNPIEALVGHMSNVGNPTTMKPGGLG